MSGDTGSGLGKQTKMGFWSWITCQLAGNKAPVSGGLSMVFPSPCNYSAIVKIFTGDELEWGVRGRE